MADEKNLNAFRLCRIARGKKINDLAAELIVTRAYIYQIEKGERSPSKRLFRDYCSALDIPEPMMQKLIQELPATGSFEKALLTVLQVICSEE